MLIITAYILSLLFLPFKEEIADIANNRIFTSGEKVIASFTSIDPNNEKVQIVTLEGTLKEFPAIPRRKKDEKDPVVWAKRFVSLDADSGRVLCEKDMYERIPIASLTKVMTALIANERITDWKEVTTISTYAAMAGGSGVDFLSGEKFSLDDIFKAMVMNSDNTAARAIAEHVSGSEEEFVKLMNQRAEELGLKNTHFADASGLDDENSYSCAHDIAVIAKEALKYPYIWETMKIPSHIEIVGKDYSSTPHRVGNTNKLLGEYGKMVGGKTGFTYNAGYCLLMVAEEKGKGKVVGVVLDAGQIGRWTEIKKLLEWSFDSHKWSVMP